GRSSIVRHYAAARAIVHLRRPCLRPTCIEAEFSATNERALRTKSTPMANTSWLPPIVAAASERLVKAINLPDLAGSTVWLAVTGLRRSGKTVFTTTLIHNLLSAVQNPNRMPLLNVVGDRRLIAAHLEGARAQTLARFPYISNIETMASGSPNWPA